MNTKLKKILIILIVILFLILIGLLIYNFVIKKSPINGDDNNDTDVPDEEEIFVPEPEAKIRAISQGPVFAPTLTNDKTKIAYYLRSNGNVWQVDFNGSNANQVSGASLNNLAKIIWSPDKRSVITIYQDELENINKYFYSYTTGKAILLSKYINSVVWSPDNKKIAYQYQNDFTGENNISIANPDGSKYSNLLSTRMKDLVLNWPQGSEIFLQEKPSGLVTSSLYSLNSSTRSFNKIISDVYGLSIKWSPKGDKILFSKTNSNGKNISIFVANRNGTEEDAIEVATLAEKCVWSQDTRYIFCAIPQNIDQAGILPDDFYKGTFIASDEFYKINIETGEKENIINETMNKSFNASDLFLSAEENYLFFTNKGDGLLYSIRLD